MALQLAIVRTSWITDSTGKVTGFTIENTTGDYDADVNPGGFGAPNPLRSDVQVVLFASQYDAATGALLPLAIADYDGQTDDEYTIMLNGDGIVLIHAFAPPRALPTGTFPAGTQYYDTSDLAFMQTTADDTLLGVIAVQDLDTALTGLAVGDVEIHERNIQNANYLRSQFFKPLECGCDCKSKAFTDYQRLNAWLESGVKENFNQGNYFGAAKVLDAINAIN